jgi:hypothetical protein
LDAIWVTAPILQLGSGRAHVFLCDLRVFAFWLVLRDLNRPRLGTGFAGTNDLEMGRPAAQDGDVDNRLQLPGPKAETR